MLKLLPYILDYASKKVVQSLNDDKETKLDKVVRFLISEKVRNSITTFYTVYIQAVDKLQGEEGINKMIEESSENI
jgi:ferritin-like protein